MAINTYATLKDAVQRWAKRNDILGTIDDFVDLAEADIWQRLRVRDMEARATASASTADRFLELPTGFLEMRKVRLYSGSTQYDLKYAAPESLDVIPSAGIPTSFTVTSQLEFNRIPNSAFTVEMQYYRELTALSSSSTTSAILTRFPMIYLYGCLFHFAQWALDDQLLTKYSLLFDEAINAANKADKKGRHGPAPSMRREGPTP